MMYGWQVYTKLSHTKALLFGPELGGLRFSADWKRTGRDGSYSGSVLATRDRPLRGCGSATFGATRLKIHRRGTEGLHVEKQTTQPSSGLVRSGARRRQRLGAECGTQPLHMP